MELSNATILLTGATGGFGQQFTRQLTAAGSRLILTDRDAAALDAAAQATPTAVIQCIPADLGTAEGCAALCAALTTPPDILINNAGIAVYGRFDETPEPVWEKLLAVNLMAPMRLAHHFLPAMIERGSGHIVNISSIAGWLGTPGLNPYSVSKFGLRGFGEALHEELRRYPGIHVTNVYPFYSRTPILDPPVYGSFKPPTGPASLIDEPDAVIREAIAGIQQNKLHVFPGPTAKRLHLLKRYAPKWLPRLMKL